MIVSARAKINWTLNITGKREDGYHLLESVVQRIALCDRLAIDPSRDLVLRLSGEVPAPEGDDNLVIRAAKLLKETAGVPFGARITLEKAIPTGAGLGGGSADAAAALTGLNRFWNCGLSTEALEKIAIRIGADVPYCLHDRPMLMAGVGETLSPLPDLPSLPLVLLRGERSLSTPRIYRDFDLLPPDPPADTAAAIQTIRQNAFGPERNGAFGNMLQKPAVLSLPEIGGWIRLLYESGAVFAQMTGSGSCVFGVFPDADRARAAAAALAEKAPVCILTATV